MVNLYLGRGFGNVQYLCEAYPTHNLSPNRLNSRCKR